METLAHHIWIGFAGGLLGFAHCLGMCGGFAVYLSQGKSGTKMVAGQLLWLAGKLFSYLFLGAVAGFLGRSIENLLPNLDLLRNLLSYLAGALILMMGLSLFGLLPIGKRSREGFVESLLVSLSQKFLTAASPGAALALGLATGFLPCPIVLAFLAYALQSGSVATGMVTMGALGLGTMLPLLLLGSITRLSGIHLRSWAPKAGALLLIILGLTTALRGTAIFHRLLGCPAEPTLSQAATDAKKPCCTGELHGNGSGK
jgi:uncharacterized protein